MPSCGIWDARCTACSPNAGERALFVHNIHLTRRKAGPYHLALAKPKGLRETWMIAGNEPTSAETFKECGERFGIEENFPGDKSNDVPALPLHSPILSNWHGSTERLGIAPLQQNPPC